MMIKNLPLGFEGSGSSPGAATKTPENQALLIALSSERESTRMTGAAHGNFMVTSALARVPRGARHLGILSGHLVELVTEIRRQLDVAARS